MRSVVSVSPTFALAATLLACSAPSQNPSMATGAHAGAQAVEQCSIFGVMACSAMTVLSGERGAASTCSAYRASSGTRVETCGSEAKATQAKSVTTKANTHTVRLSWSDNSNNEESFVVERCDQVSQSGEGQSKTVFCSGGWKSLGTVAANITRYVDHTALLNQTYLYRVKATNSAGGSNYTAEVPVTTPPSQ